MMSYLHECEETVIDQNDECELGYLIGGLSCWVTWHLNGISSLPKYFPFLKCLCVLMKLLEYKAYPIYGAGYGVCTELTFRQCSFQVAQVCSHFSTL